MFKMPFLLKLFLFVLFICLLTAIALTFKILTIGCFQMGEFFEWIERTRLGVFINTHIVPD